MGDRAVIVVTDGNVIAPAAVYTHWAGSDAPELIKQAGEAKIIRKGDTAYALARLCGYFHEQDTRTIYGLGLIKSPKDLTDTTLSGDYSHGDAGVIVVDVGTGLVRYVGGYLKPDGTSGYDDEESQTNPSRDYTKIDLVEA